MSAAPQRLGAICGLVAAALFGASAPLCKLLVPSAGPLLLAGLLYLGAGLGLSIFSRLQPKVSAREAPLVRKDLALLLLIILSGGALGPVLMLFGLSRLHGVPAALLLNLEAPFTILLAVSLFGDHVGRREGLAAILICGGASLLALRSTGETTAHSLDFVGAAALAGACALWALDNNLTQRLSLRDPVALVKWKTLGAGLCNCGLAFLLGHKLPPAKAIGWALGLGSLSYGLSVVLDAYALRLLGAAREAALFATAPFVGAILAIPLLGERPGSVEAAAAIGIALGVGLLLRARHSHAHRHEALEHEHAHVHDEHHQHEHPPELPAVRPGEAHSHPHRHAELTHDHPHVPDLHHRHSH